MEPSSVSYLYCIKQISLCIQKYNNTVLRVILFYISLFLVLGTVYFKYLIFPRWFAVFNDS